MSFTLKERDKYFLIVKICHTWPTCWPDPWMESVQ